MKLLKYSLFLLAPLGQLSAAVVTFEDLAYDTPLTTGWSLTEANVTAEGPIAYVDTLNSQKVGALGGEFRDATNDSVKLTMSSSLTSQYVTVSMDLLLKDSNNSNPSRDAFGFSVANGSGATIVQLNFLPVAQSVVPSDTVAQWQISYLIAGGSTVLTNYVLTEESLYAMNVVFANNGVSITFGNSLGSQTINGVIANFNAGVNGVGNLGFDWAKAAGNTAYGDNKMFFDNINVTPVPEPSVALMSGLAALTLLQRRRK
jgi:hypothetical protein